MSNDSLPTVLRDLLLKTRVGSAPGKACVAVPLLRLLAPNTYGCTSWLFLPTAGRTIRIRVVAGSGVSCCCPAVQGHLCADCVFASGMRIMELADLARIGAVSRSLFARRKIVGVRLCPANKRSVQLVPDDDGLAPATTFLCNEGLVLAGRHLFNIRDQGTLKYVDRAPI
jgi:hypothetical protein